MPHRPTIEVAFTPEFKRNLRTLAKKYPHIRSDVQPIIEQIQRGEFVGDQVKGIGYTIFKLRIRNSDISRGKSGGYRVIYYLKTATAVILVTIYSKTEQSDISAATIRKILTEFGKSL
ncbi:MAG: type II toxin-antitoxin system RelE/ParE family toxin [Chloroflexota bacterium]